MIVFGTDCNFFIALPIQLKTCRFNVIFYVSKCTHTNIRARLRGFARLKAPDRHRARNLSLPDLEALKTMK